jgi:hypothetical protein
MSSSSVGRPALASWSLNSSPSAVRIFVIFEYPSSPSRPFSRASSVESPTLAFFASMGCVMPSVLRLAAICSPNKDRGSTHPIYKVLLCYGNDITSYNGCSGLLPREGRRFGVQPGMIRWPKSLTDRGVNGYKQSSTSLGNSQVLAAELF